MSLRERRIFMFTSDVWRWILHRIQIHDGVFAHRKTLLQSQGDFKKYSKQTAVSVMESKENVVTLNATLLTSSCFDVDELMLQISCCGRWNKWFTKEHQKCSPSGNFLLLAVAGLDFLLLTVDPRLLIPLITDIVSSSAPACREFLYEMRGSQQSSLCRAIWNVMNRSKYMWLQKVKWQ